MQQIPLISGVLKYIDEKNIPFTMPGHKGGEGFLQTEEGRAFYNNIFKADITEVDGVDNLHNPEGIIEESLLGLSHYYKSSKSYYLINGSTCGNLAMIYSCFNRGDKIILERNCHRSVMNAVIMRELKPVYIKNHIDLRYQCGFSYNKGDLVNLIKNNQDAKGVMITWPNYYGICADLKFIVEEAHKYGMKVLVDCAHGAHFGIIEELPQNPMELGCDMVVMSCHKTLSSFTQTAYLHIGQSVDSSKTDFYVSALMSTSPSYIMMMSMEYAWFYLYKYGHKKYKEFYSLCNKYRNKINKLSGLHVIGDEDMYSDESSCLSTRIDNTRFVINLDKKYSAHKLLNYLREKKIQAEMSDGRNVILIPSPFNDEREFKYLYDALRLCRLNSFCEQFVPCIDYSIGEKILEPCEVMDKSTENVKYELSEKRVAAESIVPYPPGIPLVVQGERINKEAIDVIRYYLKNQLTVLGVDHGLIKVIKN
ncbi:Arginine/lysine/ornithine decarboxylase [Hathewaya proteolytica DSM 3090]|uniref:Arginine/lysine/ornithine decarboxylase n=1 Tax=Hathewaya proteolytica DSM 3090 TaxID=1121331 RepID=A0A1M6T3C1_9CLOT|nr:aminotransferase class V-fold PLP-dependent enzyme [Hathewaya proteolytica]SHK51441.1 Arginine/lysine/ornithine decarboxylase [Hathewaya proteolytica DSM 3090]